MENYKSLYLQSEKEKKKLKAHVLKLQDEIRQRCYNFYAEMKRRKRAKPILSIQNTIELVVDNIQPTQPSGNGIIQGLKQRIKQLHHNKTTTVKKIQQLEHSLQLKDQQLLSQQQLISSIQEQAHQLQSYRHSLQNMFKEIYVIEDHQTVQQKMNSIQNYLQKVDSSKFSQSSECTPYKQLQQSNIIANAPYIVEEDLNIPTNTYIKRGFVRKKVIKRNLSVYSNRSQRSLNQSQRTTFQELKKSKIKPIQGLSRSLIKNRISQISRESDAPEEILQIETRKPQKTCYSVHIFQRPKDKLSKSQIRH